MVGLRNLTKLVFTVFIVIVFNLPAVAEEQLLQIEGDNSLPELDCVIEPSEVVDVGTAIPGVIESIHVQRSDLIKKGDILVELDSSVEKATNNLAQFRASLNTVIEQRQRSVEFGHNTQKRNQILLQKSAISMHEIDQLNTETRIAELQVKQEQENKRLARLEYQRAQAVLKQRTIRSPVDGVVMENYTAVGEFVDDEPVLRVARLDPLYVEVIVPVKYLGRISPGMQAEVTAAIPGLDKFLATVDRVDRVADAASGTYGVRLSLSNPEYKVPVGLRCLLGFLSQEQQEAEVLASSNDPLPEIEQTSDSRLDEAPELEDLKSTDQAESFKSDLIVPDESEIIAQEQPENCYSIGPVTDKTMANKLSKNLKNLSIEPPVLRSEFAEHEDGYLVLAVLGTDANSKDVHELKSQLKSVDITNSFVLSSGPHKGRLSLAYFQKQKLAIALQKRLASIGIKGEIVPRQKQTRHYWIDVSLQQGANFSRQLQNVIPTSPASFKAVACSQLLVNR